MSNIVSIENPEKQALNAHNFLQAFLDKFPHAKRGGIHDFMEIALFNMVNSSVKNIDDYCRIGHSEINPQEVMSIFCSSCQIVLDGIKRNLDGLDRVVFK